MRNEVTILFMGALILLAIRKKASFRRQNWFLIYTPLFFSTAFLFSNDNNINSLTFKDIVESLKPLFQYGLIIVGLWCSRYIFKERQAESQLFLFFYFQIALSAFVFIPILWPLVDFFKGRESDELRHFFRFSGTFGYPGAFGQWLSLVLLLHVDRLVRFKLKGDYKIYFLTLLVGAGLIFTASRVGIVVFFISLFIYFISYSRQSLFFMTRLFPIVVFGVIIVVYFFGSNEDVTRISDYLLQIDSINALQQSSFAHRLKELSELLSTLEKYPLLGAGPSNYAYTAPVESAYFYFGYKFGLFGIFYLVVFAILPLILPGETNRVFFIWNLVVVLVGGFSNAISEEYLSVLLYPFILGALSTYGGNTVGNR